MQLERRSEQRLEVSLSVELSHADSAGTTCRVHNLAPEGMLLENNQQLSTIGARVELQIKWSDRSWNIPALITHCNSECIGVMFCQRQSELYRTVTQLTSSHGLPKSRRHFVVS